MSIPTRSPLRWAGACLVSGNANTGEMSLVRGGAQNFTVWSGNAFLSGMAPGIPTAVANAGYDILAVSGGGRLNSVFATIQASSGLPVIFYDAAAVSSGGPFPLSGHRYLGQLPPTFLGGSSSGAVVNAPGYNAPLNIDAPFFSGLCIANKSGQVGYFVTWTPAADPLSGQAVQN